MSEVRRHTSNIRHPKNQKKQGTSATQIVFKLKMNQETLVHIKTDSALAQKKSRKNTQISLILKKNWFLVSDVTRFDSN